MEIDAEELNEAEYIEILGVLLKVDDETLAEILEAATEAYGQMSDTQDPRIGDACVALQSTHDSLPPASSEE